MTIKLRGAKVRIFYMPDFALFIFGTIFGIAVLAMLLKPSTWPYLLAATALLLLGVQVVTLKVGERTVSYTRRSLLVPRRAIEADRGAFAVRAREDDFGGDRPSHVELLGTSMDDAIERDDSYPPAFECDNPRQIAAWIATVMAVPNHAPVEAVRPPPVATRASDDELPVARVVNRARGGRS